MKEKRLTLSSNPSGQVSFDRPSSEFRSRFIELKAIRGLVKSGLGGCEQVKLDTPVSIITPPPHHHTCEFSSSTRAEQHPSSFDRRSWGSRQLQNRSGPRLQPIQIQYLLLEGNAMMGILVQMGISVRWFLPLGGEFSTFGA